MYSYHLFSLCGRVGLVPKNQTGDLQLVLNHSPEISSVHVRWFIILCISKMIDNLMPDASVNFFYISNKSSFYWIIIPPSFRKLNVHKIMIGYNIPNYKIPKWQNPEYPQNSQFLNPNLHSSETGKSKSKTYIYRRYRENFNDNLTKIEIKMEFFHATILKFCGISYVKFPIKSMIFLGNRRKIFYIRKLPVFCPVSGQSGRKEGKIAYNKDLESF